MTDNSFRDLPPVDTLVDSLRSDLPRGLLVDLARDALDEARESLQDGKTADPLQIAQHRADQMFRSRGTTVINASGVLLHTNLGRARWSERAGERAAEAGRQTTNLEMDLSDGSRRRRGSYVTELATKLTGAEDAIVVNNNASALVLALAAIAAGKSTVVARGELIEIGGSYRLPDVMSASGTRMVEVGTTNRSRLGDYQTASQLHDVAAILKVHPSNYRVVGFTSEATVQDLAKLDPDVPVLHDIGSGLLDNTSSWIPLWLADEPAAAQSVRAGAGLVMFSGDKLLGGPQAGLMVGTAEAVGRLRAHPLARALRVDGVTYAALGATLESYLDGPPTDIPFWRQALTTVEDMEPRANRTASAVGGQVETGSSAVGGGSAPGVEIPTLLVRIEGRDDLFAPLLIGTTSVLSRREDGDLLLDLRTVDIDQDQTLIDAVLKCL